MNLHRILLFEMITTNAAPLSALPPSWIYLSFQDDNHPASFLTCKGMGWIYLSFQDDNHCIPFSICAIMVGYTFHFKMITTWLPCIINLEELDIPFISR